MSRTRPRYITNPDQSIQFLKQGPPPMEVPGYDVDPGDPYTFYPTLPPCSARTFKMISVDCCPQGKAVRHCSKYGYYSMTPQKCKECAQAGSHQEPNEQP